MRVHGAVHLRLKQGSQTHQTTSNIYVRVCCWLQCCNEIEKPKKSFVDTSPCNACRLSVASNEHTYKHTHHEGSYAPWDIRPRILSVARSDSACLA